MLIRAGFLILVAACGGVPGSVTPDGGPGGSPDGPPAGADGPGGGGGDAPASGPDATPDAAPVLPRADGLYDLVSPVDVTASALLPQPAYEYYDLLRQLREDPANTLFTVLSDAGVPLVDELRAALPDSLEAQLAAWINDYVQSAVFMDGPVADELQLLFDYAEMSLAQLHLVSELELAEPAVDGTAAARHELLALRFHIGGEAIDVPAPPEIPPIDVDVPVVARLLPATTAADGALELGDHAFAVTYGALAYEALNEAIRRRYGMDVRGTLGLLIDCPALAADVAGRCILSLCVGHEAELEALCERGLDEVEARLQAEFEALRFDAIHLMSGEAELWDVLASEPADGVADRIDMGVWDAEVDYGQGPRAVPASFTGTRR